MPNVFLKNEIGEDVEYDNIDSVTLRKVEGGTATYTFGNPITTDNWKLVDGILSGDGRTTMFTKYTITVPSGKLVSYTEPAFGTWFQSRYDAWRISALCLNQMYSVPGGAILACNTTGGKIYFWDDNEKTLTELSENGAPINNFREYAGKYFIAAYKGWYLFDAEAKTMSPLIEGNGMSAYSFETEEELLLSVANSSSKCPKGIFRLDAQTLELTQIYDQGSYWLGNFRTNKGLQQAASYIAETEHGYLFSANSSGSQYGVLYYDSIQKTVTRVITDGYYYFNMGIQTRYGYSTWARIIPGFGIVFSSSSNASWGTWYYDFKTDELTRLVQTGFFNNWVETDDLMLGSHSSYGALVFVKATKTWYRPVTTGQYDSAVLLENGILLGCSSASYGLQYYDFNTGEATRISNTYSNWRFMIAVNGGALLSNTTSNSGVFFFDETEQMLTQLTTTGCEWYMVKRHDSVLMGSFNSNVYGWHFYKDGVLTYNAGVDSNARCMRCISVVEDGWVISSHSYSSRVMFIDGETGEAKDLLFSTSQTGPYMPYWYGHNGAWKPTYDYNRKYGRYRVISSYDAYGFIFDDISHEAVPLYYWNNTSETPQTTFVRHTNLRRVSFTELGNSTVMILNGSSSSNGAIVFNYSTGIAYFFTSTSMYANNDYTYWFTPLIWLIPVSDGYLIAVKPFDYSKYPVTLTSSAGVWHYNPSTSCLRQIFNSGYYDSTEDAPGGFYLYLSSLPVECRLYWNSETNTLTKVEY